MKKLLLLALALALPGCTQNPHDVSLDHLLTNPLFAERYAEEMIDAVVELKIQNDPILQDNGKADAIEKVRTTWLVAARDATKKQQEGMLGSYVPVSAEGKGEFLYLNDVLFTDTVFTVIPGPKLQVYMTTVVDPRDVEFPDETALFIDTLQSPYGAQRYNIPHQEDPLYYRTVVLWDDVLDRIWGFVQLSR